MTSLESEPIVRVEDLQTWFFSGKRVGKAVDGVSFELRRGETLGLMGESGSGKSLTALSMIGLNPKPASRVVGGNVHLNGVDLLALPESKLRTYRGKHIAMVLQDPMSALNPAFTVGHQIAESLRLHTDLRGRAMRERAVDLLRLLQIPDPKARLANYPHQMSGGMRQRVVGAIALAAEPSVLIADEPTTSLDVTVQAAYLRLLRDIQQQTGLAILFITHDFGVAARICDRVAVMYAGRIIEMGGIREMLSSPSHPYTRALIRSVPDSSSAVTTRLPSIAGEPASLFEPEPGCPFAPRCPDRMDHCGRSDPPVSATAHGVVRCWLHTEGTG